MQDVEDAWITFACTACGVWTDLEDVYDALVAILPDGPGRAGETVDLSDLVIPNGIISPVPGHPYYYQYPLRGKALWSWSFIVFSVIEWNLSGQEERWTERDGDVIRTWVGKLKGPVCVGPTSHLVGERPQYVWRALFPSGNWNSPVDHSPMCYEVEWEETPREVYRVLLESEYQRLIRRRINYHIED